MVLGASERGPSIGASEDGFSAGGLRAGFVRLGRMPTGDFSLAMPHARTDHDGHARSGVFPFVFPPPPNRVLMRINAVPMG